MTSEMSANKDVPSFRWELTDLNGRIAPTTDHDKEFLQNQWASYEEEFHDAVIKIGKTEFKVSKFPFMSQSSVFKAMFLSKFKEGTTSEIEIKDIDEDTMKHFVKWMYTGQIEDESPVEKLFAAAEKYDVKVLKKMCSENMIDSLDATNAFQRLILASMHSHEKLKNAALNLISELPSTDFADFLVSDKWTDFAKKNETIANEIQKLIHDEMSK